MYTPREGVLVQQVGEELVLLDVSSGTYYGLNDVGLVVWESLTRGLAVGEAVDLVRARFEVDAARAAQDVGDLVQELLHRGLLTPTR